MVSDELKLYMACRFVVSEVYMACRFVVNEELKICACRLMINARGIATVFFEI